jgi:DNA-binding response OmpR family regulator
MQARFFRVLVVDDERFFREAIQDALSGAGIECLMAADGAEALEIVEEPTIGAVVLDVRLPGMDGLEVLGRIREKRRALPVIILSAHQDQSYVLDALRQGASDYLAKPLHEEELTLAVQRALETYEHAATAETLRSRLAQLQHGAARLVALARSGDAAAELHAAVAQTVSDVLGADKASLMLLDATGSELRVVAATGSKLPPEEMDPVPVGEGVAGLCLARSEPMWVSDVTTDPRFKERSTRDRYVSTGFVVAPVVAGDRALGVLCSSDPREGGTPYPEDLLLLRVLAQQAAALLSTEDESAVKAGMGISAPEATTLPIDEAGGPENGEMARAICDAVVAEVEPVRVIAGALAAAGEALGAQCTALYLRNLEGGLTCEGAWSSAEAADREELAIGRGLTGTVLETGRPVATDEPSRDPRFDAQVDTPAAGEIGPFLCLPMRFRGKTLGVFRAFLAPPARTSPRAGEVLTAALSTVVRNVLLYRSLVDSIEEVARARRESRDPS